MILVNEILITLYTDSLDKKRTTIQIGIVPWSTLALSDKCDCRCFSLWGRHHDTNKEWFSAQPIKTSTRQRAVLCMSVTNMRHTGTPRRFWRSRINVYQKKTRKYLQQETRAEAMYISTSALAVNISGDVTRHVGGDKTRRRPPETRLDGRSIRL